MKTNCDNEHKCAGGTEENCDYFDICDCGFCMAKSRGLCAHNDYQGNCENSTAWPENQKEDVD